MAKNSFPFRFTAVIVLGAFASVCCIFLGEMTHGAPPSSGTISPTLAPMDACTILTPSDAESAFGSPAVEPPVSGPNDSVTSICEYKDQAGNEKISLQIIRYRYGDQIDHYFTASKDFIGDKGKFVSDLGDDAVFDPALQQLHVRLRRYYIIFSATLDDGQDVQGAIAMIASEALERLP